MTRILRLFRPVAVQRTAWRLTWRGWLLVSSTVAGLALGTILGIHPFLAVTDREDSTVLVVEGWIPDYALVEAWGVYKSGGYSSLLTTGGPCGSGVDLEPDDTYARVAASRLKRFVGPEAQAEIVHAPASDRDRTYTAALALRRWLDSRGQPVQSVDVVTLGAHARRTRLIYKKALGDSIRVGVISIRNREYDARHWWRYSEGVRDVVGETIAYCYARFLFHP